MKVYLVGGAVRDELLGLDVNERDWVVVGSTPEEMLAQGFKPVGKDFPVFLHPKTHEEYALARTERKVAKGYRGFTFHASPDVSLEEDLKRRDLTINAIAKDSKTGEYIDPFRGQEDIKSKLFRHVSEAFSEDPVRLLRVCRFSSRFSSFSIQEDTFSLMQDMLKSGEVSALVPERVWQELEKSLGYQSPQLFFSTCINIGAFKIIFGNFEGKISAKSLGRACELSTNKAVRFASFFCRLSKEEVVALCNKLRAPKAFSELLTIAQECRQRINSLAAQNGEEILGLLEKNDAFRRPERFEQLLLVCHADSGEKNYPQTEILLKALKACNKLTLSAPEKALTGKAIAKVIQSKRLQRIKDTI